MSSKLGHEAKQLVGKNYGKASQTTEKLVGNIERIAEFMSTQGLQSISDMKTKHVTNFFENLREQGLGASTMAGYATAMRSIANAIGKQNIVPRHNNDLGIDRSDRYQPKHGDADKMAEVLDRLYSRYEWTGLAADMAKEFGLRRAEALRSNEVVQKDGKEFLVVEGAKGGRPRQVEIERKDQQELVQKVQDYIRNNNQKALIPSHMSLKQGLDKLKNEVHRAGGTKQNKANLHVYRHEDAQRKEREGKTDKEIAAHLGHGRESVVKHYK